MKGRKTTDIARALAAKGLFVSNGDFYAATVIERLGQGADGVVRIGAASYTAPAEIERVVAALND